MLVPVSVIALIYSIQIDRLLCSSLGACWHHPFSFDLCTRARTISIAFVLLLLFTKVSIINRLRAEKRTFGLFQR